MPDRSSRTPAEAAPARIRPLARLPVFLDLRDRPVLVAGGSDASAWKAELLAAAGARVTVFAATPGTVLLTLAAQALDAGSISIVPHDWQPTDFAGMALAVADCDSDEAAVRFRAAAQAAGIPSMVIDTPAHSDFQFGAIVNRSPVVIGISTAGAAPVLGQAIRRRIETLLPHDLAAWAAAAARIRGRIARLLPTAAARRAFWEKAAERIFAGLPGAASDDALLALAGRDGVAGGRVTMVGAGPGDAELLTLKAMRALQAADIILFDDLVSAEVLELARREAKRMMVGKRGRRASCRQDDINALMVRLARQGKHVVRLKSGDPMIFGRAGEEIASLRAAGIPVEVVPGITAGIAAASRLGVSLTHRDHAHSVRFVTGHARDGSLPQDLDWRGIADAETTTIFYMGGRTAPEIAARLLAEGLPGETPAVALASVSRADEQRWQGSLQDLLAAPPFRDSAAPVLIGVGRSFAAVQAAAIEETERGARSA